MSSKRFYIPTTEPNKFIKFVIDFNRERTHWATGASKQIGYYVTALPITKNGMWEESGAFTGFYELVMPIERQGKKRMETAVSVVHSRMAKYKEFFKQRGIEFKN